MDDLRKASYAITQFSHNKIIVMIPPDPGLIKCNIDESDTFDTGISGAVDSHSHAQKLSAQEDRDQTAAVTNRHHGEMQGL